MPEWIKHREYCRKFGIPDDISDFANKLCDFPEQVVPTLFQLHHDWLQSISDKLAISNEQLETILRETEEYRRKRQGAWYCINHCTLREKCKPIVNHENQTVTLHGIQSIQDLVWLRHACPLEKSNSNAITHSKVHQTWVSEYDLFRSILMELAEGALPEHGKNAVRLHLELDEESHILQSLQRSLYNILATGIKGTVRFENRYLPTTGVVRKYLKDVHLLSRLLSGKNREVFCQNLKKVFEMKISEVLEMQTDKKDIIDMTVYEFAAKHEDELKWLEDLQAICLVHVS